MQKWTFLFGLVFGLSSASISSAKDGTTLVKIPVAKLLPNEDYAYCDNPMNYHDHPSPLVTLTFTFCKGEISKSGKCKEPVPQVPFDVSVAEVCDFFAVIKDLEIEEKAGYLIVEQHAPNQIIRGIEKANSSHIHLF